MGKHARHKHKTARHEDHPAVDPQSADAVEGAAEQQADENAGCLAFVGMYVFSYVVVTAARILIPLRLMHRLDSDVYSIASVAGIALLVLGFRLRTWLRLRNHRRLRSDAADPQPADLHLWGNSLPYVVMLAGSLALTVALFFFAQEFNRADLTELYVGPKTRGAVWTLYSLVVMLDIMLLWVLAGNRGRTEIDLAGVRFPDLWRDALPWSTIADARVETEKAGSALVFSLKTRRPVSLRPRRRIFGRARYGDNGFSLHIPGNVTLLPLQDFAAMVRQRCGVPSAEGPTETIQMEREE